MSELRHPLGPSLSFSGTSSMSIVAKFPKRRTTSTSTLDFFAPAATSFQPRPYAPHAESSEARSRAFATRTQSRSHDTLAIPGMDPQSTDPNVVFIHPPFITFPNSHLYSDGLSYQILAENPEWFLDANDFISQHNSNSLGIPYPSHLEPPRGWCPAKKKDLKDRGTEGWPEGEEPRLRCTFCRRTYAGVNAKSMWRRHVFEKHKIAMSNRRDGNDRPRGRGSGKENKHLSSNRMREEPHDRLVNLDIGPQTEPESVSHRSRFRSLLPSDDQKPRRDRERKKEKDVFIVPPTPRLPQNEFPVPSELEVIIQAEPEIQHIASPPLTPHSSQASDPPNASSEGSIGSLGTSPAAAIVPPSPYDPLVTPSFRHSPPRLPSDQPWRFPSPSHPLHSQTRDLSLSMLIRDTTSPLIKVPAILGGSPANFDSSPTSTPIAPRSDYFKTPSSGKLSGKPANRPWFFKCHLVSPLDAQSVGKISTPEGSPLARSARGTKGHKRASSSLSDDWLISGLLSSTDLSLHGVNNDPFDHVYNPWNPIVSARTPEQRTKPILEAESPVLRSGPLPTGVGLGIGLLEPFILPRETALPDEIDAEFNKMLESRTGETMGISSIPRKKTQPEGPPELSPPTKKRKMLIEAA